MRCMWTSTLPIYSVQAKTPHLLGYGHRIPGGAEGPQPLGLVEHDDEPPHRPPLRLPYKLHQPTRRDDLVQAAVPAETAALNHSRSRSLTGWHIP
jgi:hypothetical protein